VVAARARSGERVGEHPVGAGRVRLSSRVARNDEDEPSARPRIGPADSASREGIDAILAREIETIPDLRLWAGCCSENWRPTAGRDPAPQGRRRGRLTNRGPDVSARVSQGAEVHRRLWGSDCRSPNSRRGGCFQTVLSRANAELAYSILI